MAAEDDSDIPDTGAVFTFGKSKFADNLPNKFWVRNDRVLEVACGDEHTALVAESGRVFTFGSNDWGQLGLGTSTTADRPSCIKSLKHEKVRLVACGRVHTIVATESGKIYSFGANGEGQLGVDDSPSSNVPKCIDSLLDQQYKMLAAGADHSVALTEDGAVFVWGSGGEGQLGMGGKTECPEPEELRIEENVTCISCGYYHTALVTESGDLYTFGESDGGKLGLGDDPDDTDMPQKVLIPEKVKSVACGGAHTVALTEQGNVYTFGEGPSGQLGHGTHCLQTTTPRKLSINFKVKDVACGENHTSIISEKGQQYTFGDGRHGKLGLGQESFSNQFVPQRVKRFSKFSVEKVSCGGCHMICLGKLRLDNDEYSSEDEPITEPKMNGLLNHSLRPDGSIDLNNSVTARDRRRKHNDSFKIDLNRTLPPLKTDKAEEVETLYKTVPAVKSRHPATPPKQRKINGQSKDPEEVHEEAISAVSREGVKSSPKPLPRPVPRKPSTPPESEEESEEEEEEEEIKEKQTPTVHAAPIPPPRALPKRIEEYESEEEEDEEEEKKEVKKEKKKKAKTKKSKNIGLFGRKSTGLSDDEDEGEDEGEEEEEEEDEEEEVKEEKKDKKKGKKEEKEDKKKKGKKDKKKDKKGKKDKEEKDKEEEEEDEDEEEEEKEKTKDKKDKKKDKGKKKDKKKDKKGKKDKEDEEEEEEDEEEKDEKKDKKKEKDKKKDKKKDKEKKDKDKKKDDEKEESEKEDKGEKEESDEKKKTEEEDKKDEKPPEPPKKKSRTCTIL